MSAFVVSLAHIRQLVALALEGPGDRAPQYPGGGWYPPYYTYRSEETGELVSLNARDQSPDRLVSMLAHECVRSVCYRYPDDTAATLPGPLDRYYNDPSRLTYERPRRILSAADGINAAGCYEYQACEHPEWYDSEARAFVNALVSSLTRTIPAVRDSRMWEYDEETVTA